MCSIKMTKITLSSQRHIDFATYNGHYAFAKQLEKNGSRFSWTATTALLIPASK